MLLVCMMRYCFIFLHAVRCWLLVAIVVCCCVMLLFVRSLLLFSIVFAVMRCRYARCCCLLMAGVVRCLLLSLAATVCCLLFVIGCLSFDVCGLLCVVCYSSWFAAVVC